VKISRQLLDELVAHVLEDPANEICGVVAVGGDDGAGPEDASAVQVYRAANKHASPMKFEIEPAELLALYDAIDERGWRIGAIYHSHVRSRAYPSQTDVNFAANWPGVEWIIVGLAAGEQPDVHSYLIEDGAIREVPLRVS
jgi:[CysO sulfur-carrier protein]-S-L-cysteine hydrolase